MTNPVHSAKAAGLRYVCDGRPGIRREMGPLGFKYKDFTSKDFRTWAGTVLAATALREFEKFDSQTRAKRNVMRAIEAVAKMLGNTTAVCRKSYIHPAIVDAYMDGSMLQTLSRRANQAMRKKVSRLRPEEAAVLAILQRRLASEARKKKKAA